MLKNKQKTNEGITLIALVITIIVLLILAGVAINLTIDRGGLFDKANNIVEKWNNGVNNEQDILGELMYALDGPDTSGANPPLKKDGMEFITYTASGEPKVVTDENTGWYAYKEQDGATDVANSAGDYGTSKWANGRLNGNYYVWIPRYAYKIDKSVSYEGRSVTYENGVTSTSISYKIDVKFIGTDVTSENVSEKVGSGYIVHPAFTFENQPLTGIWVGKFETTGTEQTPTILPNETGLANMDVATMWNTAKKLSTENYDSHMMKNTEWGAVAYLAQSQYGRNGTEISVNQYSEYMTGAGKAIGENKTYESTTYNTITDSQRYNGSIGKASSTTGNIYGVYDMVGGKWEYVMGVYGTTTPVLGNTGFTEENLPSSKYYDLYSAVDTTNIGDALNETKGWNLDANSFMSDSAPVLRRGGVCNNTHNAGIFMYYRGDGTSANICSFRVALTQVILRR